MNYTYVLRCADGSLYCGWTNHLEDRIAAHNAGRGAKYTRGRGPVLLAYYESYDTKEEAMRREAAIKRLTKEQKEIMIQVPRRKTMKIIISPAKRMQVKNDEMLWRGVPPFLNEAKELLHRLKEYSEAELKELYRANASITHENYLRWRDMELTKNLTPAALAYVGIQYQYMAPQIFSEEQWAYVCRHLRILSGFYGILKADDGIVPYRLEMQAKLRTEAADDLYSFWGPELYKELRREEDGPPRADGGCLILNLASKEYSKAIEPYLRPEDKFVTCVFGGIQDGQVKVKATEAKMARGEMVRFLAEKQADSFKMVKEFDRLDFSFSSELSTETKFVFIKRKNYDSIADEIMY